VVSEAPELMAGDDDKVFTTSLNVTTPKTVNRATSYAISSVGDNNKRLRGITLLKLTTDGH